jgi:hypothetical protein
LGTILRAVRFLFAAIFVSYIVGCQSSPKQDAPQVIKDDPLRDRVFACGQVFGVKEGASAQLVASYDKARNEGKVGIEAAREAGATLLSQVPESDRLKLYDSYVRCIDKTAPEPK